MAAARLAAPPAEHPSLKGAQPVRVAALATVLTVVLALMLMLLRRDAVPAPGVGQPFTATITRVSYDETEACYTGSPSHDGETCTVLYHQERTISMGQQVRGVEMWLPGRQNMVHAFAVDPHS